MRIAEQLPGSPPRRTNYLRRAVGIALGFGPVALLLTSCAFAVVERTGGVAGLGFALVGFLFGLLNAYLAFVRPRLYRRRRGSMEGYRFVSGLPLFGTLFVVLAGVSGFGEVPTAVVGLVALALDTGGLPWFLILTWHDGGMWDA